MSAFVPTRRIDDLVLADPVPGGDHLERLWSGALPDDDGALPVVYRGGPAPWGGSDPDALPVASDVLAYARRRLTLRRLLEGQGVPRVLRLVYDDRLSTTEAIGAVEEHAGDLTVMGLLRRNREGGGQLPLGVAVAVARGMAVAHAALERAEPERHMSALPSETFIDDRGIIRTIADPRPTWEDRSTEAARGGKGGDLRYLSPEEIAGRPVDGRAPMFTLGVVLYELVTGRHPFHDEGAGSIIRLLGAMLKSPMPSLPTDRGDVPATLVRLVDRLTRPQAGERFATWREVLTALDDAIDPGERASDAGLAAFCAGLCPEEMAMTRARREDVVAADLARIDVPTQPFRRLGPALRRAR